MGRFARVVAARVAHHVTQRGNAKRYILESDEDRAVYLKLLLENLERHQASLLGYCLMSNHVHLVVVPEETGSMALILTNGGVKDWRTSRLPPVSCPQVSGFPMQPYPNNLMNQLSNSYTVLPGHQ